MVNNSISNWILRFLIIPFITLSVMYCTLWLFYRLNDWKGVDTEQITTGSELDQRMLISNELRPVSGQVDKNLPLFYMSTIHNSLPNNIFSIPLAYRENLIELCKEVGQRDLMQQYIHWLHQQLDEFDSVRGDKNLEISTLIELLTLSSLADLERVLMLSKNPELKQWGNKIFHQGSPDSKSVANRGLRWIWHGKENIFHHQLTLLSNGSTAHVNRNGQVIWTTFIHSMKWTLSYTLPGFLMALLISLWIVVMGHTINPNIWFMRFARFWSLALYSIPTFVIGLLALIFLTSHRFGWVSRLFPFPTFYSVRVDGFIDIFVLYGNQLILPMILFAIWPGIVFFRLFDEKLKNITQETGVNGYLMQLGMSKNKIRFKYLPSFLMVSGFAAFSNMFVGLFGGSLILEMIFNMPGLGRWFYDSVLYLDVNTTLFLVVLFTLLHQIGHLLSDLAISIFIKGSIGKVVQSEEYEV